MHPGKKLGQAQKVQHTNLQNQFKQLSFLFQFITLIIWMQFSRAEQLRINVQEKISGATEIMVHYSNTTVVATHI